MDNEHPSWVAAFPRAINGVTPDNRGNAPCSGSTVPAPPRPARKEYHNKNALSRQFRLFSSADDDFGNPNPDLPQKSAPTTPMPHPTDTIPPPYRHQQPVSQPPTIRHQINHPRFKTMPQHKRHSASMQKKYGKSMGEQRKRPGNQAICPLPKRWWRLLVFPNLRLSHFCRPYPSKSVPKTTAPGAFRHHQPFPFIRRTGKYGTMYGRASAG